MKKATPKNSNIQSNKTKEYRKLKLKDFNKSELEKTLLLLKQLKRPGIGHYKIKENEIQGLTNADITWILNVINPIYSDRIDSIDITEYEKYAEGVEVIKTKDKITIKTPANLIANPVFFFSGLEDGGGRYLERTFMVGPLLDSALGDIEKLLKKSKYYLTIKDDIFYYNNSPLKISNQTILYRVIKCVYDYFEGKNGEIQFKDLHKELKKIKGFSRKTKPELSLLIRQNLTSKSSGIGKKIGLRKSDVNNLFKTEDSKKLIFKNEKVND